ncbi:Hypothetical predicted protein [Mytilus galloprovincialis]|uniref:CAP-Gly domain-containing protein n=1 Tax=Mytilus galloprovincialis TaxID=29158 RepID=A0A8B6GJN3_MYTGA|nr:Hypothetical predicted protein [Mytilus galloprovincialis]
MKLLATKEIFYYGKTLALHSKKDNSVYFLVDNYDELFGLESTFDAEKDLKYITECLQQIEVKQCLDKLYIENELHSNPDNKVKGSKLYMGIGQHDGFYKSKRYYTCKKDHGIFVPLQEILCKVNKKPPKLLKSPSREGKIEEVTKLVSMPLVSIPQHILKIKDKIIIIQWINTISFPDDIDELTVCTILLGDSLFKPFTVKCVTNCNNLINQ